MTNHHNNQSSSITSSSSSISSSTEEKTTSQCNLVEYRIVGLSCANCARELQGEIQKLQHGESASLLYNSSRLIVSPNIDLSAVRRILKSDGASLVLPAQEDKFSDHEHSVSSGQPDTRVQAQPSAHTVPRRGDTSHEHDHTHDQDHHHNTHHGHDHGHSDSHLGKWLLSLSALLYVSTFLLDGHVAGNALITVYLFAIVLSGYSTFLRGLRNLLRLKFNMDTLMTVALTGAVLIGEWKEATLVAILFGLNEILEGYGMNRARQSMEALLSSAPKQAIRLDGEAEVSVPIAELQIGDIVIVRSGEKIPSDGTVIEGYSSVNEAAITGESVPVAKKPQSKVFGGSVNEEGLLKVRIDKSYEDSSLAKIMYLVKEAQDTKTPTELFIDKFAKYYTPAIMLIAAAIALLPPLLFGQPWMKWIYEGLAVLIVGCPCALVLSSPIALVSGMTRCARNGVLIKGGVYLEQLGKVKAVAFDKTGTLTVGKPKVLKEIVYNPAQFHRIAFALESNSLHPLAKSVTSYILERDTSKQSLSAMNSSSLNLITLPGVGLKAEIDGAIYLAGSEEILQQVTYAHSNNYQQVKNDLAKLKEQGLTVVAVASESEVLGLFGLADELRTESPDVIANLHRAGIEHTVMLTGDHAGTAKAIATKSGVSAWYAGLLPEQKVEQIQSISKRWKVAMVGDGVNDAPALATADLGIAMGKGTDSAVETADIVLMQDHLGKLPQAIRIARHTSRVIAWNIGISLSLKLIALLLTIPGWLTLWIAVMSDMGATILVTLLGLTVLLGKDNTGAITTESARAYSDQIQRG